MNNNLMIHIAMINTMLWLIQMFEIIAHLMSVNYTVHIASNK